MNQPVGVSLPAVLFQRSLDGGADSESPIVRLSAVLSGVSQAAPVPWRQQGGGLPA